MDLRRSEVIRLSERYLGRPYVFGGKSPATSFDCSGLMTHNARVAGLDLGDPYYTSAAALMKPAIIVPEQDGRVGDYYLWVRTYDAGASNPNSYPTHCGWFIRPGVTLDTHGSPWPGVGYTDVTSHYWRSRQYPANMIWRPVAYVDTLEEEEEDILVIQALRTTLGYLQDDVEAAIRSAAEGAREALRNGDYEQADELLGAALAACNTLRDEGRV